MTKEHKNSLPPNIRVISHPLVQHKLSILRNKGTHDAIFRNTLKEIGILLTYELLIDAKLKTVAVNTHMANMHTKVIDDSKMVCLPILRAGNGLLNGVLELLPQIKVGHIGLYREPNTLAAVEYYLKFPTIIKNSRIIIVDPILTPVLFKKELLF